MKLTPRPYRDEEDYWRIRAFLRQVMLLNELRERSWHVARLDYWRWHVIENCRACDAVAHGDAVEQTIFLWEAPDGRIEAVLNPEGGGEAHFQVHPELRTPELEEAMLDVAEQRLAVQRPDGRRSLLVYADSSDDMRHDLLARRGYKLADWPDAAEHQRRQPLSAPLPAITAPAGYTVRPLGDAAELPARSWVSWRAFHPDEPNEKYEGWTWYHNIQRQPLYRRDLDIVAVPEQPTITEYHAHGRDGRVLHRLVRRCDTHRLLRAGGRRAGAPAPRPGQGSAGRDAAPAPADGVRGGVRGRLQHPGERALCLGGVHGV